LTLPIKANNGNHLTNKDIYVLAWGDDGWIKVSDIEVKDKSVNITVLENIFGPFVVVIDK